MRIAHVCGIVMLVAVLCSVLAKPGCLAMLARGPRTVYNAACELFIDGPKRDKDLEWNRQLNERRLEKWRAAQRKH